MRVALYVTCMVDQCWPSIGLAAARLLRLAGCEVLFDQAQTCCGQPACNTGYQQDGRRLARAVIEQFERSGAEAMVLPSGSCTAQIHHYPGLFAAEPSWQQRATAVAERTFELSQFLVEQRQLSAVPGRHPGKVALHDACHGLRDLGVHRQPRALLAMVEGLQLVELPDPGACCGFGGTFSVKLPDLATAIADHKLATVAAAGVDTVVSVDASCLLHLRTRLQRLQQPVRTLHLAEVLVGGAGDD
jgi:L-lactate dehydrogenase complex protein LldE